MTSISVSLLGIDFTIVDFWLVLILIFIILPFTYYYAEEVLVSDDGGKDLIFGRD